MKIQNTILLVAIEILSNFMELNAMWEPHEEDSPMPNFIPHTPRPRGGAREGAGRPRNPNLTLEYLGRIITVHTTTSRHTGIPVAKDCILDGDENHGVPDHFYREDHDYYTLALYGTLFGYEIKCVVYVEQDIGRFPKILGAKPPPKGTSRSETGIPMYLNPDKNTWYITYAGLDFVVKQDFIDGHTVTESIAPMHYYNNHPTRHQITTGLVDTFEGYVGGQRFLAFLNDGYPLGCMVPPRWWTDEVQARVLSFRRNARKTMRMYIRERQQRGY